jgi:hypothetical protein
MNFRFIYEDHDGHTDRGRQSVKSSVSGKSGTAGIYLAPNYRSRPAKVGNGAWAVFALEGNEGRQWVETPRSEARTGRSGIGALPPFTGTGTKDPLLPIAGLAVARTPKSLWRLV